MIMRTGIQQMNILVIGGTRYFGIHMVKKLLKDGHDVTIATRGNAADSYGENVKRIIIERTNEESVKNALEGKHFDGVSSELVWCDRMAFPYEEIKRQAEYALWQKYSDKKWIAVRYPFAIRKDDYTNRLRFYVEHVIKSIPMNVDNVNCQMGFIRSDEEGQFIAFLVEKNVEGAMEEAASKCAEEHENEYIVEQECLEKSDEVASIRRAG